MGAVFVPLADDTPVAIEARQIAAWRDMRPAEKAAIVAALTTVSQQLALAGVRSRYPDRSPREHFLRLAIVNHGVDLARKAYPEIATLEYP